MVPHAPWLQRLTPYWRNVRRIARDANQEVPDWLAKFEKTKANKQWKVADAVLS